MTDHNAFDEAIWLRPATVPMFSGDGSAEGFMCKTDFECEAGAAEGGVTVYPSEENLRERRPCAASCGIVRVRIVAVEVVQEESWPDD